MLILVWGHIHIQQQCSETPKGGGLDVYFRIQPILECNLFLWGKTLFLSHLDTVPSNRRNPLYVFSFIVVFYCLLHGIWLIKRGSKIDHDIYFTPNTVLRPPIFVTHKTSFLLGKWLLYHFLTHRPILTHETLMTLKKALFVRKNELFFDWKWLFCEGFLKMSYFGVWRTDFGTLRKGVCLGVFECR